MVVKTKFLNHKEVHSILSDKICKINSILVECQKLACEYNVSFRFDVAGYGMGVLMIGKKLSILLLPKVVK